MINVVVEMVWSKTRGPCSVVLMLISVACVAWTLAALFVVRTLP
jgi:hypothetical protein